MKVSSNLAKWAYAWNYALDRNPYRHESISLRWDNRYHAYPENISLCPLFWRTFVVTPAFILTGLFLTAGTLTIIRDSLLPIVVISAAAFTIAGAIWAIGKLFPAKVRHAISDAVYMAAAKVSPVFAGLGRIKKTMCPVYEVEKD